MENNSLIFVTIDIIGLFLLIVSWKMAGGARAIYAFGLLLLSLFLLYEGVVQITFFSKIQNLSEEPNLLLSLVDNFVSNLIWTLFIVAFMLIAISFGLLAKGKLVKVATTFAIIFFVLMGLLLPTGLLPFAIFGILGLLFIYRKTFEHNFFVGMKILLSRNS
jgi:hypothetical protein